MIKRSISQTEVRANRPRGAVGKLVYMSSKRNRTGSYISSNPQRAKIATLTVDSFSAGHVYTFTIEGRTLAYEAIAGDTNVAGVAAKIAALIEGDAQARGVVSAIASSAVVTLTGLTPGFDFEIAESDARLTLAVAQTSDEADPIGFGLACARDTSAPSGQGARLLKSGVLSGDVLVLTPAVVNLAAYTLDIFAPDGVTMYPAAYTADGSATAQKIVEGLKAAIDAFSIADLTTSEDNAALTVNLPVGYRAIFNGANWTSAVVTNGNSIENAFVGLSRFVHDEGYHNEYGNAYAPNSAMAILESGSMYVEMENALASDIVNGGSVYVELSGDDAGRLFAAPSATRVMLPRSRARWIEHAGDNVAIVELI